MDVGAYGHSPCQLNHPFRDEILVEKRANERILTLIFEDSLSRNE